MRVLFLAAEVAPFSKAGGLGDVAGALPAALAARGVEVVVVSPLYPEVPRSALEPLRERLALRFPFGVEEARLWRSRASPRHDRWFVEHPGFFARAGIYGERGGEYPDNPRRFAFFSIAALEAALRLGWIPDVVHLNDWHTGLAALALHRGYAGTPLAHAGVLFTIHNLAYQGLAPKSVMTELGLPWDAFTPEGLEFEDRVNFLKAGVVFSDRLTTVSPRYAEEICTPQGGWGMDGTLRARRSELRGILNGVDHVTWNPRTDVHLPAHYGPGALAGKRRCKQALLRQYRLAKAGALDEPLFAIVSRLAPQKGIDLLLHALPRALEAPMRFVALGSGEPRLEAGLRKLAERFPERVSVKIGFDEAWAHQVEAGADFFLMPSQFEPCGLNQMYSLRYGTVPVVRATGGLDDTVVDLSEPGATGIKFRDFTASALSGALERALALYAQPAALADVRARGMARDFSWAVAATDYEREYQELAEAKTLLRPRKEK